MSVTLSNNQKKTYPMPVLNVVLFYSQIWIETAEIRRSIERFATKNLRNS